jgi:hypothetical protein
MLIGISGRMGSGKDTAANIIQELDPSFKIKRFAGKLKEIASMFLGIPAEDFNKQEVKQIVLPHEWDQMVPYIPGMEGFVDINKQMTVREFLQKLGTDAVRNGLHPNAWVNALFADYKAHAAMFKGEDESYMPCWIIPDVRFTNEFDAIKARGGVVVRIERGERAASDHQSEIELDNAAFDYVIYNNGPIADLREDIHSLLTKIFSQQIKA